MTDRAGTGKEPTIRWRARLSRVERWVIFTVAALLLFFGAYKLREARNVRTQRESMMTSSAAEAATLSRHEAEILDLTRGWITETAAASYPGDQILPELTAPGAIEAFLSRQGLYVRAAQPDVRPRFLPEAIRTSIKDAFVFCLLAPPETTSDYDLTVAVTRAPPGSPVFDAVTRWVERLEGVQRGFRVLSPDWREEVSAASPLGLRALALEYEKRTPAEIKVAKDWTAAAAYVAVVVDELPDGVSPSEAGTDLAESFQTSMLPAIEGKPHDVRVALFEMETRKPALRLRIHVDPAAFATRTGSPHSVAAQDCYLASAVRRRGKAP